MSHVAFLAENFFNVIQFPLHTVTGLGDGLGEVFRVGASRRSATNALSLPAGGGLVQVACDRVREADTLILDRNTSTLGSIELHGSASPVFADLEVILDLDFPDKVVQGSNFDDPVHGIRTEEGVAIYHFEARAWPFWRVFFTDTATVGGIYLGKSYRPTYPRLPFDEASRWETFGTVRRGVPDNDIRTGKSASVSMMMRDEQEWDTARWTLRQLFGVGHPMWFIHTPNTERAWLAHNVDGSVSAPFAERPQGRTVVVGLEEYDPALP